MGFRIFIDSTVLEYDEIEKQRWIDGDCTGCSDSYCLRLSGNKGFGEYLVGRHFAALDYEWIHHGFDLFGTNKPRKYPFSEAINLNHFRKQKHDVIRNSDRAIYPLHEPYKVLFEQERS